MCECWACYCCTFALVNCTMGPSSDTTWFPTWMNGILPGKRREGRPNKKCRELLCFTGKNVNFQLNKEWICDFWDITLEAFSYLIVCLATTRTNQRATCTRRLLCKPLALVGRTSWGRPAQTGGRTPESVRQLPIHPVRTFKHSGRREAHLDSKGWGTVWQQDLILWVDLRRGGGWSNVNINSLSLWQRLIYRVTYPSAAGTRLPSQAKALQLSVSRNTRADTQTGEQSSVKRLLQYDIIYFGARLFWRTSGVSLGSIYSLQTEHKWTAMDCLTGRVYSVCFPDQGSPPYESCWSDCPLFCATTWLALQWQLVAKASPA